jgi:hypothetical protein
MNKPMPDHLVLPLESFAAFTARTLLDRTVVRSQIGVHILVGARATLECELR